MNELMKPMLLPGRTPPDLKSKLMDGWLDWWVDGWMGVMLNEGFMNEL